jgi:4-carboxymuconolactone decarboxylase
MAARIPQLISSETIPADKRHIFDAIMKSRGQISGPFSILLHSPDIAGRVAHLGAHIRFESTLSAVDRELAIITAARESDSDYEWSAHAVLARQAGVRQEAIDVVAKRGPLGTLTTDEALIVQYGRELLRNHRVSDTTFQAALTRFGNQGVVELTATMGYYTMLACVLNAFAVEPVPGTPRLP